ncbi:MAG: DUF4139 domain-containing protein [Burkholderiales bacterium]
MVIFYESSTLFKRAAAAASALALTLVQGEAKSADTANALTIYSTGYTRSASGYAVVKQERNLELAKGRNSVRFSDVPARIDATTVSFASLTDPAGTRVLEQDYQYDLVSTDKLLERFLGQTISVEQTRGDGVATFSGILLSKSGQLVLQQANGSVEVLSHYNSVRVPELPGGLISKPTLLWDIAASKPGTHRTRVTYQTAGMAWWADYNLVFSEGKNANSGILDVGAWVSIINESGAGYPDARLKLVAGDVHRAEQSYPMAAMAMESKRAAAMDDTGFQEKAFFEYHLYTLGRTTTLSDNSTKQIELFPAARAVPAEKLMVYYGLAPEYRGFLPNPILDRDYGSNFNTKVDLYLQFKNQQAIGLGVPLPAGRVRVSKLDSADNSLEFIGEDTIDHTPKDEKVLVKLGSAFDVVGERRQIEFKSGDHWLEEEIEVKLRNHKDDPVTVIVKENLYRWINWEVTRKSHPYEKADARTIQFPVTVARDGETVVRYTVRYAW